MSSTSSPNSIFQPDTRASPRLKVGLSSLPTLALWLLGVPLAAAVAHEHLGLAIQAQGIWGWLAILLLYPVVEEVLLRPLAQEAMAARLGEPHAVALATLIFAALHIGRVGAWAFLWILPGLLLARLWANHRSLPANILGHVYLNAVLAAVGLLLALA